MRTGNICRRRSRGAAAVEMAILLPIFMSLLIFPIFFGRVYWHYTVAQKAAQDAARYLSSVSFQELRSVRLAPQAAAIAQEIARIELSELAPGGMSPQIEIYCGLLACAGLGARPAPTYVRVVVRMDMVDTLFGIVNTGRYGLPITVNVSMPYVGQ
jgi:hypothetical protein